MPASSGPDSDLSPPADRRLRLAARLVAYTSSAAVVAPFLYHLWSGSIAYLGLFQDDYYYYAIIADKLVRTGKLTYDGITTTNGFHPLWFAVIAIARMLFGRFSPAFYTAFAAITFAATIATYELGVRLGRRLGLSPALAWGAPALLALPAAQLLTTGLEAAVAVPLYLWLLLEATSTTPLTPRRVAWLGFVSSLVILARLDLAIAVALLVAVLVYTTRPTGRQLGQWSLAFGAGGVLVPVYGLLNYVLVGSPLPVSALAKRLITAPGFSLNYLRVASTDSVYGPAMAILLPLGGVAAVRTVMMTRGYARTCWLAATSAVAFAAVFFGLNAFASWVFFGWYAYPMHAAALVSILAIGYQLATPRVPARAVAWAVALACAVQPYYAFRYYRSHGPLWTPADNGLLAMSLQLEPVMRRHDGLVAMGAVAGIATYVMDRPVLQVEGIVADLRMLEHVKAQDALGSVLREYGADYLVVSLAGGVPMETRDGCYVITQPHQEWAGTRTAKMRGALCAQPLARFWTIGGAHPWSIFTRMETWVWDLRGAVWR